MNTQIDINRKSVNSGGVIGSSSNALALRLRRICAEQDSQPEIRFPVFELFGDRAR
jgi:hypothetical protein